MVNLILQAAYLKQADDPSMDQCHSRASAQVTQSVSLLFQFYPDFHFAAAEMMYAIVPIALAAFLMPLQMLCLFRLPFLP